MINKINITIYKQTYNKIVSEAIKNNQTIEQYLKSLMDEITEIRPVRQKSGVKYPCKGCIYFNACGENTRTYPCNGRKTKSEQKKEKRDKA